MRVTRKPLRKSLARNAPSLSNKSLVQELLEALERDPALAEQLKHLLAEPKAGDLSETGACYQATLNGNGAIAQGNAAQAAGAGAVSAGGRVSGTVLTGHHSRVINTDGGTYIEGNVVTGGGNFTGRDGRD